MISIDFYTSKSRETCLLMTMRQPIRDDITQLELLQRSLLRYAK